MRHLGLLASFVGAAAFAALVSSPAFVKAATRTLGKQAFVVTYRTANSQGTITNMGLQAAIPVGTDFPTSAISGAYFDFNGRANTRLTLQLMKATYTGSYYTDYLSYNVTENRMHDLWVPAVNVNTGASQYDYVFANIAGSTRYLDSDMHGVALMTR